MSLPNLLRRSSHNGKRHDASDVLPVLSVGAGRSPNAAYLRGRAEFDSVFSDLAKGKRNWQLIAFAAMGVSLVLALGLTTLATQSRITPYVVEVDKLGRAQSFGPAERLAVTDQRVVTSELAGFVRNIRSVVGDPAAQADLVRHAYAFVAESAAPFLNAYFSAPANDPRLLGRDMTRLVDVSGVLPVPGAAPGTQTWKVDWTETTLPRTGGGQPTTTAWEGYFTTRTVPPATADRITVNPLGLFVISINWTQLSAAIPTGATTAASADVGAAEAPVAPSTPAPGVTP